MIFSRHKFGFTVTGGNTLYVATDAMPLIRR